jgi:integrase
MRYTSFSVRQVSNRKGKPWQARLNYKDPITNKYKQLSKYLDNCSGKREAQQLARQWMDQMNNQSDSPIDNEKKETIDEVVAHYIDYQYAIGALETSTRDKQRYSYHKYVSPYLGKYVFKELDRVAIIDWHTHLSALGLAQSTIRYAYAIINKVYDYYVLIEEIEKNPFDTVRVPMKDKVKVSHLTDEQIDNFVKEVYDTYPAGSPGRTGFLIALYSGLRRGEICGLRWRDVDFEMNRLTVSSAIGMKDGGCYTKQPKNAASARTFPMIPQLVEVLKEAYRVNNPEASDFVVSYDGDYLNPCSFSNAFMRFCEKKGLTDAYGKRLHLHALRHNFATIGMRASVDVGALSAMLGHMRKTTTLDIYGDVNEDSKKVATEKITDIFGE